MVYTQSTGMVILGQSCSGDPDQNIIIQETPTYLEDPTRELISTWATSYKQQQRSQLPTVMGDLAADHPAWWRWAYLGLWQSSSQLQMISPTLARGRWAYLGSAMLKPAKSLILTWHASNYKVHNSSILLSALFLMKTRRESLYTTKPISSDDTNPQPHYKGEKV